MIYYVIPDIHGRLDKLNLVFDKLENVEDRQFIFLGDYIDRGDKNVETINRLIQHKKDRSESIFLLGNHEELLLGSIDKKYIDKTSALHNISQKEIRKIWFNNGGDLTFIEYKSFDKIPDEHIQFYRSLLSIYLTNNIIFVHAGINKNIPLNLNDLSDFLWIRPPFGVTYESKRLVIHGHTPGRKIIRDNIENRICVDTSFSGPLHVLEITDKQEILDLHIF